MTITARYNDKKRVDSDQITNFKLCSECNLPTQIVDCGKNKRIVEKVFSLISQQTILNDYRN